MTENLIICPECKKEAREKPEIITSTITTSTIQFPLTYSTTDIESSITSKTYKCSNPDCWVTKVELSWG